MIGMAFVRPRRKNDRWTPSPHNLDDLHFLIAAGAQPSVTEIELFAKSGAEDVGGYSRFTKTGLRIASRPHLAACQVDDAGAPSVADHLRDRPAASELDVVGMRREEHCID